MAVGGEPEVEDGPEKESREEGGWGEGLEADRTLGRPHRGLQGLKGEQVLLEGSKFPLSEACQRGMADHLERMLWKSKPR